PSSMPPERRAAARRRARQPDMLRHIALTLHIHRISIATRAKGETVDGVLPDPLFRQETVRAHGLRPDRRLSHRAPLLQLPGGRTGRPRTIRPRRTRPADQPDRHLPRNLPDRPTAFVPRGLRPVRRATGAPQRRRLWIRAQLDVSPPARHWRHP